jgi:hypothetical protein
MSTSKYIFSALLFLMLFTTNAQNPIKDTVTNKTERYGIRVGADLYKFTRSAFDKNYQGIELVGDYRITKKYYLAGEIGNENKTTDDDRLHFTTKGTYFKVGVDYNFYDNWLDMENMIFIGFRYGVSSFSQELNSYKIYNPNPYFGELPPVISGQKYDGLTAHWGEFVVGIKAELCNNFYAGFSMRVNRLFVNNKPNEFDNLYIPGFNKTYGGNIGVGLNYTLTYFVPFDKKKISAPLKKQ